jgi:hypothetical protein
VSDKYQIETPEAASRKEREKKKGSEAERKSLDAHSENKHSDTIPVVHDKLPRSQKHDLKEQKNIQPELIEHDKPKFDVQIGKAELLGKNDNQKFDIGIGPAEIEKQHKQQFDVEIGAAQDLVKKDKSTESLSAKGLSQFEREKVQKQKVGANENHSHREGLTPDKYQGLIEKERNSKDEPNNEKARLNARSNTMPTAENKRQLSRGRNFEGDYLLEPEFMKMDNHKFTSDKTLGKDLLKKDKKDVQVEIGDAELEPMDKKDVQVELGQIEFEKRDNPEKKEKIVQFESKNFSSKERPTKSTENNEAISHTGNQTKHEDPSIWMDETAIADQFEQFRTSRLKEISEEKARMMDARLPTDEDRKEGRQILDRGMDHWGWRWRANSYSSIDMNKMNELRRGTSDGAIIGEGLEKLEIPHLAIVGAEMLAHLEGALGLGISLGGVALEIGALAGLLYKIGEANETLSAADRRRAYFNFTAHGIADQLALDLGKRIDVIHEPKDNAILHWAYDRGREFVKTLSPVEKRQLGSELLWPKYWSNSISDYHSKYQNRESHYYEGLMDRFDTYQNVTGESIPSEREEERPHTPQDISLEHMLISDDRNKQNVQVEIADAELEPKDKNDGNTSSRVDGLSGRMDSKLVKPGEKSENLNRKGIPKNSGDEPINLSFDSSQRKDNSAFQKIIEIHTDSDHPIDLISMGRNKEMSFRALSYASWQSNPEIQKSLRENNASLQLAEVGEFLTAAKFDSYTLRLDWRNMPSDLSPESFLQGLLVDPNKTVNYSHFDDRSTFSRRNKSESPKIGDIYDIRIPVFGLPGDNGSVMLVERSDTHFIFQTVKTPETGTHPENGIREFGFQRLDGGLIEFYTRGISKPHSEIHDAGNKFLGNPFWWLSESGTEHNNDLQHQTWRLMMEGISDELNRLRGKSELSTLTCYRKDIETGEELINDSLLLGGTSDFYKNRQEREVPRNAIDNRNKAILEKSDRRIHLGNEQKRIKELSPDLVHKEPLSKSPERLTIKNSRPRSSLARMDHHDLIFPSDPEKKDVVKLHEDQKRDKQKFTSDRGLEKDLIKRNDPAKKKKRK